MINTINLNKPWITPGICKSIRMKSKYFKLYKRGIIYLKKNIQYKNLLYKIISADKRSYLFTNFKSSLHLKLFFLGIVIPIVMFFLGIDIVIVCQMSDASVCVFKGRIFHVIITN